MYLNYLIIAILALLGTAAIAAVVVLLIMHKKHKAVAAANGNNDNAAYIKKRRTNIIIIVVILAVFITGAIIYFTANKQPDNSRFYGTYKCQVQQGEYDTTYKIVLAEPQTQGIYLYCGEYSATSTNPTSSFSYHIQHTISGKNITISFNRGNTISGAFDDNGNLLINKIGKQTDLLFIKIQ